MTLPHTLSARETLTIIGVAPNGGTRTKADHPDIPIAPAELARTAAECLAAGAAMIHVHVRDNEGRHLLDADAYADVTRAIRREVGDGLVLQITSESLGRYKAEEQMAVVRAVRPEAASLALRELAPDAASETSLAEFLSWMQRERILPQIILYAPEEAARLRELQNRGLLPSVGLPVLYVLGRYSAGQNSSPGDLLPFLQGSANPSWMVCAFGRGEAACATAAALLGGDIRVGFENSIQRPDGTVAASNAETVTRIASLLAGCGHSIGTAATARERWLPS